MSSSTYFPPPESRGGWRYLTEPDHVREVAKMDPDKLDLVCRREEFLHGGDSWGIAIIRHGYLVREHYTFNVLIPTRFDIWSCTKSFTGTAWGMLLDDSRNGLLPGGRQVDLDSRAYDFIPEGHPLTDPRKQAITVRHLLTMTSGIAGENQGLAGNPTRTGQGPFEHALGRCPNRFGLHTDLLTGTPGSVWNYSDPAFAHLSLAFSNLMGLEIHTYLQERLWNSIGIEHLSWDPQGGSGHIGPHTNAHTGISISARELARFGYLMLNKGNWQGQQLVPQEWVELSTQSSQELNKNYGVTWWVKSHGTLWPGLPKDAFAAMGYRSNKCYVIPSLDLVVTRVGSGPSNWAEQLLIGGIVDAVMTE